MRVKLSERREETPDTMTFVFNLNGQSYPYTAGQYAFFELDALTVPDARGNRRHFTLSSSPTEHGVVQFTTRLRGSGFKETLRSAPLGTEVTLEEPQGDFVLPTGAQQPIVFLAGGIGVTPFRSILRCTADEILPYNLTLLYAAQSPAQLAFRREFEFLPEEHSNLQIVFIVNDSGGDPAYKGELGMIDTDKIRKYAPDLANTLFYSSGPPPMVKAMQDLLKSLNVPDEHIRVEHFSGYGE
jgi:ferredoxin-NADP reductase